MRRPSPYDPNFGLHLWLGKSRGLSVRERWSEEFEATDTFMLLGQGEQRVYVIPSQELVIVRLGRPAPGWDDPRIPNLLVRALRKKS